MGIILGIDPGVNGSLSIITHTNEVQFVDSPKIKVKHGNDVDLPGMYKILKNLKFQADQLDLPILCVIERVWLRAQEHTVSANKLLRSAYTWLGLATGIFLPNNVYEVAPRTWQSHFSLVGASKKASIEMACILYPEIKPYLGENDNRAEALLLAHYGKETIIGED